MSFDHKLDRILARAEELRFMLSGTLAGDAFVKASKELSELTPIEVRITELRAAEKAQAEAQTMLADPEMKDLAAAELEDLKQQIPELEMSLRLALLPKDEMDDRSAILEIRPAAGGDEAGLFAAELFRAYQKYSALHGCRFEVMEYGESELGGVEGRHRRNHRQIRVRQVEIRIRRSPRAARAGNRNSRAHPHLHRNRGRAAGSRGSGR